jgi:LytS/YehU family sensor histidine kinase
VFYLVMLAVVDSLLETIGMGNFLNMRLIAEIAMILLLALIVPFYIFYFLWQTGFKGDSKVLWRTVGVISIFVLPFGYMLLDDQPITLVLYAKSLVLVFFFSILGYLFRGFLNGLRLKSEKEVLQQQLLQSELAFLKGQISPHFLFNTLNNIDSLIKINPGEASRALISMSDIMRYMIYDTKEREVPLTQELHYLESLLSLYNLRFKRAGLIKYKVQGDPNGYRIAPMMLIPIAENAFKHHSDRYNKDGVVIDVVIAGDQLQLRSSNSYDPGMEKPLSFGLGLETLKRRLDLLYPGKYNMEIRHSSYTFNIELSIPLLDTANDIAIPSFG